jgi:hypothetical protein
VVAKSSLETINLLNCELRKDLSDFTVPRAMEERKERGDGRDKAQ